MGEKEWYFFYVQDRKYPTGLRTNRATDAGYWKATGKYKESFKGKTLVGMKRTLVFYKGRAPQGEKSNWMMQEYRFEGKFSAYYHLPTKSSNPKRFQEELQQEETPSLRVEFASASLPSSLMEL